ncbi:MAG: DUF3015 domain-containing protein [Deltaproteobacteria bacterium]|nr:DUF3015 domain-containing protein [Deltaproteobacteria bacterium]
MKKIILSLAAVALTFGLSTANAQSVSVQGAGGYGDAGCGLGSMLFGAQPGLVQVLAATTNSTFASQTFGITSGTSNCGASGAIVQAKQFVEGNRDAIAKDISRGQGETISSLAELGGCKNTSAVGRSLQRNYDRIFPNAAVSDLQVSDSVVRVLKKDRALSCKKLDS